MYMEDIIISNKFVSSCGGTSMKAKIISPIKYENSRLYLLDQTLLPETEKFVEIKTKEDLWEAIYHLKVRGAPAIGVGAAYGIYVVTRDIKAKNFDDFFREFCKIKQYIETSRPTAVNLFWALDRMEKRLHTLGILQGCENQACCRDCDNWQGELEGIKDELLAEAEEIFRQDEEACLAMGRNGLTLLKKDMGILTHCNAGTLATARYGTCLAPIYLGQEEGYNFKVFADETRPLLQGARLTSWELNKAGVDVTLICDNMAHTVMKKGWIDAVVVGCDRMAANGDGANKIGTAGVAVLAKEFGIPFYMFVPTSTIDLKINSGEEVVIEERKAKEIHEMWYKKPMAPRGIKTFNPSFDVTDHKYITAVITEKGIIYPPYEENLRKLFD